MPSRVFIIEVKPRKAEYDPLSRSVHAALVGDGEAPANAVVHTERLYRLEGELGDADVNRIMTELLIDPVVETGRIDADDAGAKSARGATVDVWLKPGVTDPVGETVEKGIRDLGIAAPVRAASATRYLFPKQTDGAALRRFAARHLANELIHDIRL